MLTDGVLGHWGAMLGAFPHARGSGRRLAKNDADADHHRAVCPVRGGSEIWPWVITYGEPFWGG